MDQQKNISRLVDLIDRLDHKFNDRKKPSIPKHLRSIWKHCDYWSEALALPLQTKCLNDSIPKVDWSRLRPQSFRNLPQPQRYPIHGCSPVPEVYEYGLPTPWGEATKPKFMLPEPFGASYGLKTDAGIIQVPSDPIHGYIFFEGEWVIATKPTGG